MLIAFSCKRRCLCPSCDTKRSLLFAEHLNTNVLLARPHRHVVWSIPKRFRVYFRYDRALTKHLYTAAWRAWRQTVTGLLPGTQTGAVMALHTAGDLLNFHPHVHSLCLDGAVDESGVFHQLPAIDTEQVTAQFAENVFQFLLDAELITEDVAENMRSWEHSGFNVYSAKSTQAEDTDARLFLARYLKRSPLALERISLIEAKSEPTIRIVKHLDDGEATRELSPLEFLAEIQQHIPNTWEQTTRYFGRYAARTRGKERAERQWKLKTKSDSSLGAASPDSSEFHAVGGIASTEPIQKPSRYWAAMIKRVYEVDPLVCDKCGGQMKIIAFLEKQREIEKLCENLGYPRYRAPPPLENESPPAEFNLVPIFDDLMPDSSTSFKPDWPFE